MSKNVFITAIGGDIGSTVLRCIREEYHADNIIGCDITEYNMGIKYVDKFFIAPPYTDIDKYWEFIKEICIKEKVTHFMPVTESEIKIADSNKDFFSNNKIKLLVNNSKLLNIAFSKYKTACFLKDNDINVPQTWKPDAISETIEFPIVVKGEQGCGSKNIRIVNNIEDYKKAIIEISDCIVQGYVGTEEEEYTVGVFSDGENVNSIAFKRKLGFGGMSIHVQSINDKDLQTIANEIANLLELKGCINIQLRKHDNKYFVFEINPRISSTVGFRHKMGFKDVIWWLQSLDGDLGQINYYNPNQLIGIRTLGEEIFEQK